jgi:type II secretory pathway component PulC
VVREGEAFNGWTLRSVKDRSVIIEADGRAHELTLQVVVRRTDDQDRQPRLRSPR